MNQHQSCQTCSYWRPVQPVTLGVCVEFGNYQDHASGKGCHAYDPIVDGEEVVRRGQAIMEAQRDNAELD